MATPITTAAPSTEKKGPTLRWPPENLDASGQYHEFDVSDLKKTTAEKIKIYVNNVKVITNKVIQKLHRIKELIESDAAAGETLDELDDVLDILNDTTDSNDYVNKVDPAIITSLETKKESLANALETAKTPKGAEILKAKIADTEKEITYYKKVKNEQDNIDNEKDMTKKGPLIKALKKYMQDYNNTDKTTPTYNFSILDDKFKTAKPPKVGEFVKLFGSTYQSLINDDGISFNKKGNESDKELKKKLIAEINGRLNQQLDDYLNNLREAADNSKKNSIKDATFYTSPIIDILNGRIQGGKTQKSSPFNMMKYVSGMMPQRKTQKKHRKHRKH